MSDVEHEFMGVAGGIVSSVRVRILGEHARVRVWNRGGLAGELTVAVRDWEHIVKRLLGPEAQFQAEQC